MVTGSGEKGLVSMKRFIFLTIILVCVPVVAIAANKRCAVCGKTVTSNYVNYSYNYIVCQKCAKTASRCDICNKPSAKLYSADGRHVCSSCKTGIVKCDICGKKLTSEYNKIENNSLTVCNSCARLKKCSQCGAPSRRLTSVGNSKLCESCLSRCSVCSDCGATLIDGGRHVNGKPNKTYCKTCYYKYLPCDICRQPAGYGYQKINDYQVRCKKCRLASRPVVEIAQKVSNTISIYLSAELNITLRRPIKFSAVQTSGQYSNGQETWDYLPIWVMNDPQKITISVTIAASERELYWEIANGYGNAWFWENCGNDVSSNLASAFSNWVGYKTLQHFALNEIWERVHDFNLSSRADFERLLNLEKAGGIKAVFNYVKHSPKSSPIKH